MSLSQASSRRLWAVVGVGILAVAAVVWAVAGRSGRADEKIGASTLPQELSADALKAQSAEPGKMRATMREAMQRDDLTEEQRSELMRNARTVWRSAMQERVNEYFAAAPEDKGEVLDKHLEEFRRRMQEWEQRRKEEERKGEERPEFRGMFGAQSRQERKAQSESRDPDDMARGMAYFSALRQRANERGMQLPRGGPGSRGGSGRQGGSGRRGSSGRQGGGRGP